MYSSDDFPKIITKQSITVTLKGVPKVVKSDNPVYQKLLDAFKEERWDDVPDLLKPEELVVKISDKEFRVHLGEVQVKMEDGSYWTCPLDLGDQIVLYRDQDLNFMPLANFARKLSNNPSRSAVQQLFTWIKAKNLTLKDNGNFIGYKGVRVDMTDVHTGTFDNSVGANPKVKRNEVDDNPDNLCSKGLHVGQYQYAHTFGPVCIMVEVDPKDVVAVPTDYNGEKMRVCEYKVLAIVDRPIDSPVYYDEESYEEDEEWADSYPEISSNSYEDEDEDEENDGW